jgi:hypothetical protein
MAARAKGTAWIHRNHQAIGMLPRALQPGRKNQQPSAHRIGLPVLFPSVAPILIGLVGPGDGWQGEAKGIRQAGEGMLQLLALVCRPINLWQPGKQLTLIRSLRPVLERNPRDTKHIELPDQRFLEFW